MANATKQVSIIAKEATRILENELKMTKVVFTGYEDEYSKNINGHKIGSTVTVRKPTDFTVRDGATASSQDVVEGSTSIVVNQMKGIDFQFTSTELSLDIGELSQRVIRPAMVQLANKVDADLLGLYSSVPQWAGTPGQTINSFSDFYKGVERLNELAVPMENRCAILSPADEAAMIGSQTSLYIQGAANSAYRSGDLGTIGGIPTMMSQNVKTHTTGNFAGTVLIDLAITAATTTYASIKDTNVQTIHMDGFTTAAAVVKAGDVFTIAQVWDVNPVSKERLPFLKQFTVTADATMTANEGDLIITPAIIWTGAFKNVDVEAAVTDLNNQAVTFIGSQSTGYRQNMIFHKNAFAFVSVPLEMPQGAVNASRQSYKGINVRLIPYYDGANDISKWRLDILYGLKTIEPRLATRLSGTS